MNCEICGYEAGESRESLNVCGKEYLLCGWCLARVSDYIQGNISHDVINIYWGAGHLAHQDWIGEHSIRRFLRENDIKEVFEIGTGLSTEMFVNEGMDVITLDSCKPHLELYSKLRSLGSNVEFIYYPDSQNLPDIAKLYPGRKWDFVFVDSPHYREEEVKLALTIANKFLYLHDPNLGEESFFPNDEWEPMWKMESKLYRKKI